MKDGKLLGKVHILDIIIIFAAIAVIITAIGRFSGTEIIDFNTGSSAQLKYEVTTMAYETAYFSNLRVGDVIAEDKRELKGTIVAVEIVDAVTTIVDNNGDVITNVDPKFKRAIVLIEATGEYKNPIYSVGRQEIREGLPHFIVTETCNLSGIISKIEILE